IFVILARINFTHLKTEIRPDDRRARFCAESKHHSLICRFSEFPRPLALTSGPPRRHEGIMPDDSSTVEAKEKRPVQRLPRGKRMAEIMAVTRRLIAEGGYRNLLTLDIARACGITEGAIFRYFPS